MAVSDWHFGSQSTGATWRPINRPSLSPRKKSTMSLPFPLFLRVPMRERSKLSSSKWYRFKRDQAIRMTLNNLMVGPCVTFLLVHVSPSWLVHVTSYDWSTWDSLPRSIPWLGHVVESWRVIWHAWNVQLKTDSRSDPELNCHDTWQYLIGTPLANQHAPRGTLSIGLPPLIAKSP